MIKISEKQERELWDLFDNYTRGWRVKDMEIYFTEVDTFNDFLFYLEENCSWFNWSETPLIKEMIMYYICEQIFLTTNLTNRL